MTQQTRDGGREQVALEIAGAVVADNDKLPTLPSVVWEINRLIQDDKSSATDLERLVVTDPVLTSKVLAFANSVFFGSRSTISNIRQAIVRVGLNTVQNLVLGVGVTGAFGAGGGSEGLSLTELWRHSLGVAATCATMVRQVPLSVPPEDAYTAGLLHDLGKPILMTLFPDRFRAVVEDTKQRAVTIRQAEWDILGITHDLVGDLYAQSVRFPERLRQGMRFHHQPKVVPGRPSIEVFVHVADAVINQMGIGESGNCAPPDLVPGAIDLLGLRASQLPQLAETSCQRLDEELSMLM